MEGGEKLLETSAAGEETQETEVCVGETDVPHVVQGQTETDVPQVVQGQNDVILSPTWLCFERHRVDKCLNFLPNLAQSPEEATFNKVLRIFFVITLFLAVKDLISYYMDGDWRGATIEVCAAFVIVPVLVWIMTMTKNIGSAPAKTEEVKTNRFFIQHI